MVTTGYYRILRTMGQVKVNAVGFVPEKGDVIIFRNKDLGLAPNLTPIWKSSLVANSPDAFEYLGTSYEYPA